MFKPYKILAALAICGTLTSCFKDEPLNSECDIEQAYLHADNPDEIFFQPADSLVQIGSTETVIVFKQLRSNADLTALAPMFRITEGATIEPASGTVRDFSHGPLTYKVTSEDGEWSRTYEVRITAEAPQPQEEEVVVNYDFENFHLERAKEKYYVWTDILPDGTEALNWATGNAGFTMAKPSAKPDAFPTTPYSDGFEGNAVKLTTCKTSTLAASLDMRIAAGNLFTGVFDAKNALKKGQTLQCTHFGDGANNTINYKPLKFEGYYKYTPGETFQDRLGNPVAGRTDEGDIYAVVFKNTDAEGNAFYLDGSNVLTSSQIVAKALTGHVHKTEGWTKFELDFDYISELDPEVLARYGYSLAVVFSSSCEGAEFQGAIGSTLLIDKVKITGERKKQK